MISTIVIGSSPEKRIAAVLQICSSEGIDALDIAVYSMYEEVKGKKTTVLGIENIREASENMHLSPFKGEQKALIFHAEDITIQAQNALLKVFEEPPRHTTIFLSLTNSTNLLSTILSRSKLQQLEETILVDDASFKKLQDILTLSLPAKLKMAQDIGKDKGEALFFLYGILTSYEKALYAQDEKVAFSNTELVILKKIQNAYQTITKTNVSPRFVLEHLFLSL